MKLGMPEFIYLIYTKSCDRNFIIPIKIAPVVAGLPGMLLLDAGSMIWAQ